MLVACGPVRDELADEALVVDPALTSPLLTGLGLLFLWLCARRLWPQDREAPFIAALLYMASGQILFAGMQTATQQNWARRWHSMFFQPAREAEVDSGRQIFGVIFHAAGHSDSRRNLIARPRRCRLRASQCHSTMRAEVLRGSRWQNLVLGDRLLLPMQQGR